MTEDRKAKSEASLRAKVQGLKYGPLIWAFTPFVLLLAASEEHMVFM